MKLGGRNIQFIVWNLKRRRISLYWFVWTVCSQVRGWKGLAAMLPTKRSADVTPEMILRNPDDKVRRAMGSILPLKLMGISDPTKRTYVLQIFLKTVWRNRTLLWHHCLLTTAKICFKSLAFYWKFFNNPLELANGIDCVSQSENISKRLKITMKCLSWTKFTIFFL